MANRQLFYVHIIESPSPNDLVDNRLEGKSLVTTLQLANIEAKYYLSVNQNTFFRSLIKSFRESSEKKLRPIIHISTHGDKDGITLTSGERIAWAQLQVILQPVNKIHGGFILSMSSCEGLAACRAAMTSEEEPFVGVIGNSQIVTWAETNIGFTVFYYLFNKGKTISEALKAMKVATDNNYFFFISAAVARTEYNKSLAEQMIKQLRESIKKVKEENRKTERDKE